jgi:hypothetical protein
MKTTLTIILILIALLFLQRECSRPDKVDPVPDTIRITTKVFDSILIERNIPKPYPVEVIRTVQIPSNVDTGAILADYFAKNVYHRVLMDDTTALIELTDTVHQNQLQQGTLKFRNRQPVTVHNTYVIHPPPDPRFQLYAGGFVSGSQERFGAGPALFVKTKRDHLYGIGYDALDKTAQLHMQWKISFRKN